MNVLVIDDEAQILEMIAYFLGTKELQVKTARTGEAAFSLFDKDPDFFQVIVTDVRLPDIDGIALYKRIRKQNVTLPFIFMSGHLDQEEAIQALGKAGSVAFLLKPFSLNALYVTIQKYAK